ncbi:MAG: sel1 repeat family protein, partial [Prevotella sp.]|nr:sel1 repeat family protein [Prevotella sp.]
TLGLYYRNGDGVERDYEKAFYWFNKAAEHDDPMAWVELGHCYAAGRGVAEDYSQAVRWYSRAVDYLHVRRRRWYDKSTGETFSD